MFIELTAPFKVYEVTIHTLRHLKCIKMVSKRLSLPSINAGVRIELTKMYKVGLDRVISH